MRRVFTFLLLLISIETIGQNVSNEGTEFFAVFPSHMPGTRASPAGPIFLPAQYSIFITGKEASSGTVSVNGYSIPFQLPAANTVIEIGIPRDRAYIELLDGNRLLPNRAIHVKVDPGKPKIVVYGHIFAGFRSAASLILPKESLGQQYFSMNYTTAPAGDGGSNYIALIATEANTRVNLRGPNINTQITLNNPGDVYQFTSPNDLTGVSVSVDPATSACKKFAMFSGTTNSAIMPSCPGGSAISSDPLYQQSYPVESWGRVYGFVPFSTISRTGGNARTRGNMLRVVAKDDNTVVSFDGVPVVTLNAGEFYTTPAPISDAKYITATRPVAVAQYALTQACSGGGVGDPDMVILNPVEFNIRDITVYSSSKEEISENYINVLIRTSAAASFKINGTRPAGTFLPLPGQPDYSYLQLNLNSYRGSTFNLSADEGFNAVAYGFGAVESYSYSAGTNLASSQSLNAEDPDTREEIENACRNSPFRVKVTLTSTATHLSWQFEENGPFVEQPNPTPLTRMINGTTYFDYYFPDPVSYPTGGDKSIKVRARYPSLGGCDLSEQEIDLTFKVYEPPEARFEAQGPFCTGSPVTFADESRDHGVPITKWFWDFGDGTNSTDSLAEHTYTSPGTYIVRLVVENGTTCSASSYVDTIVVTTPPTANFRYTEADCSEPEFQFYDLSTRGSTAITRWRWDFGDGTILESTNADPVTHLFARNGTYTVSLTLIPDGGCETTLSRQVNVEVPFLEVGEDAVILRGGVVDLDVVAEGNGLTYKWFPAEGLDRDDISNPRMSPTQDTRYRLTITTAEGCVRFDEMNVTVLDKPVIRNTFTPNGDGTNDTWIIDYLGSYPDVQVNIFNRFGVQVYGSVGYKTPWDGIFNGQPLPVGTYYYVIDPKMGLPVYKGWVSILR